MKPELMENRIQERLRRQAVTINGSQNEPSFSLDAGLLPGVVKVRLSDPEGNEFLSDLYRHGSNIQVDK